MLYVLEIETDNAAFHEEGGEGDRQDGREVARILRDHAEDLEEYGLHPTTLKDVNGNTVGAVQFVTDGEALGKGVALSPAHRLKELAEAINPHTLEAHDVKDLDAAREELRATILEAEKASEDRIERARR